MEGRWKGNEGFHSNLAINNCVVLRQVIAYIMSDLRMLAPRDEARPTKASTEVFNSR